MAKYRCTVCNYVYDEEEEGVKFKDLPEDWRCPVCNSPKNVFVELVGEKETISKDERTVSDVMIDQMVEWGVKYIFGIPGTSSLGVVDALRKNDQIQYYQVRHEQTAAFMASAYGKLTGHVAACLTIAGPGATNLATGLYDAKLDHAPVLALTGQVERHKIGTGATQEIDQHSFFEPICVFNKAVMSKEQSTSLVTHAIKHALLEKGVSHISIPNDIQKLPYDTKIKSFKGNLADQSLLPSNNLLKSAAKKIDNSKRPVIIAGFGAMGQGDSLIELAKKINSPIITTYRGKGVINEEHPFYMGSHGSIGSTAATELVQKSDLLIVIGSSFSDLTQIPEKSMIQIDIDPLMIAKKYPVEVGLVGNSAQIIPKLTTMLKEREDKEYQEEMKNLKQSWIELLEEEISTDKTPIRPQYIIKVLNQKLDDDAVITVDVGENCWWVGRNFWMKKTQKLLLSGNLGSMGFGLPAALTSQLTYPDRQVVCITGDGGFSMVMADFMTAVKYKLPIKVFLMNNKELGMIMQEQKVEKYPNYQTELQDCDYAGFAKNCGGIGIKVEKAEMLDDAVDKALKSKKPVLVDIDTDPRRFI
ncbi:MAG: rubredoxin [Euryarchaeota archaeon]|nr:rubredoxin [Euryarchaeota archaeon]MBU4608702.1 rubredoxin [Euryarchaeota archaeon]MBV1754940.1 rubredoxin [Methanobacterium sp.]